MLRGSFVLGEPEDRVGHFSFIFFGYQVLNIPRCIEIISDVKLEVCFVYM